MQSANVGNVECDTEMQWEYVEGKFNRDMYDAIMKHVTEHRIAQLNNRIKPISQRAQ